MPDPINQFKQVLKDHGQSITQTRLLVFTALQDKEPQSMHEVVAACQAKTDRASVYRTITLFEQLGIVQRLQIGWKYKLELSDAFHHHHHHMTCIRCGATIPLAEDIALEKRLSVLASQAGFQISGHQLEIQGTCSQCR